MAGIIGLVVLILIGGCVLFVHEAQKPAIVAKVEFTKTTVTLTNGNDQAWESAVVILNDAFDGPRANVGTIQPGERATFKLDGYLSRMAKLGAQQSPDKHSSPHGAAM